LGQLRSLPQLTALELVLSRHDDASSLMQRLTSENAVAALQAVLPTQLRSFEFSIRSGKPELIAQAQLLFKSILAALPVMPQLTALTLVPYHMPPEVRLAVLTQLPHLQKLVLYGVDLADEQVAEIKQLKLRELDVDLTSPQVVQLCQPPHSLRLKQIPDTGTSVDESTMRALIHMPTLTELGPYYLDPEVWPLLSQLPKLRRLAMDPCCTLTTERMALLSSSLSACPAPLTGLALEHVRFFDVDDEQMEEQEEEPEESSDEEQQARWTMLLRGLPQLQNLIVLVRNALPLLPLLPLHCPELVQLRLFTTTPAEELIAHLAHPTMEILDLRCTDDPLSEEQTDQLLSSSRLPELIDCTSSYCKDDFD
jgi:hypothetical protein